MPRKFGFDTVFDEAGGVVSSAPVRKAYYSAEEVEQARAEAFAEGRRSALEEAQITDSNALQDVRGQIAQAMGALAEVAHAHRVGATELALACARKIADAALDAFPDAPARAALDALAREVQGHPRLLVRAPAGAAERLQAVLGEAAAAAGYDGQVTVRTDPAMAGAAFVFEWGDGRAAFDPETAAARIQAALAGALAAEGLHAESLPLGTADHG